jgi:uracil phosphoribosyltransferase
MASNLHHFTDTPASRLLSDRTRRSDLDTRDFSEAYADLGRFLAHQVLEQFELEEYQIQHCEGPSPGVRIRDEERIGIVCLMRAGLYLAHGCRSVLRRSPLHLFSPERDKGLSPKELDELAGSRLDTLLIIDSVVNTGKTIRPIFAQAKSMGIKKVIVMVGVSPVAQGTSIAEDYPEVMFYFARLSHNSYVGKGGTDTGNRLFGTPNRE